METKLSVLAGTLLYITVILTSVINVVQTHEISSLKEIVCQAGLVDKSKTVVFRKVCK